MWTLGISLSINLLLKFGNSTELFSFFLLEMRLLSMIEETKAVILLFLEEPEEGM